MITIDATVVQSEASWFRITFSLVEKTLCQNVRLDAFLIMQAGFFAFICILLVCSIDVFGVDLKILLT